MPHLTLVQVVDRLVQLLQRLSWAAVIRTSPRRSSPPPVHPLHPLSWPVSQPRLLQPVDQPRHIGNRAHQMLTTCTAARRPHRSAGSASVVRRPLDSPWALNSRSNPPDSRLAVRITFKNASCDASGTDRACGSPSPARATHDHPVFARTLLMVVLTIAHPSNRFNRPFRSSARLHAAAHSRAAVEQYPMNAMKQLSAPAPSEPGPPPCTPTSAMDPEQRRAR